MLKLTQGEYNKILGEAEAEGACAKVLSPLRKLTPEEALAHEEAPYWCYWYAYFILKCPWPEAEYMIMRDAEVAWMYAYCVLGRPWPEAEYVINSDAYTARQYARCVLEPWQKKTEAQGA